MTYYVIVVVAQKPENVPVFQTVVIDEHPFDYLLRLREMEEATEGDTSWNIVWYNKISPTEWTYYWDKI